MAFQALKDIELNGKMYEKGDVIELESVDSRLIKFNKVKPITDAKSKKPKKDKEQEEKAKAEKDAKAKAAKEKKEKAAKAKKEKARKAKEKADASPKEELLTEISDAVEVKVEVVPSENDDA